MGRLIALAKAMLIAVCVATMISQMVLIGMLWFKGMLDREVVYDVLAAIYRVDYSAIRAKLDEADRAVDTDQPSLADQQLKRTVNDLNRDLRDMALDKGFRDMFAIQRVLETNQDRFQRTRMALIDRLNEMERGEQDVALQETQRAIESMRPRQAKEQLVMMIDDGNMDSAVAIVKAMPNDKKKKLFAEFKEGPDAEKLHEILTRIRIGEPTIPEIQAARDKINNVGTGQ